MAGSVAFQDLQLTSEQWKAVGFLSEFAKRMVLFAFLEKRTPAAALKLVKEIYRVTDEMVAGTLKSGAQPACDIRCHWCCYLRVKATPLEVLCIADFLRIWRDARELSEFRQRLAVVDETARGMAGPQRVRAKIACPLLLDGMCSAYPVRPIGCRVYHSLNLADCEVSLDAEDRGVTVRNDIAGLGMGVFAGLTEGLGAVGLQTRLLELNAGLRMAFDDPSLVLGWLAGEPAFLAAEIADAQAVETSHRRLVEALGEPWNRLSGEGLND